MTPLGSLSLIGIVGVGIFLGWRMAVANRQLNDLVSHILDDRDIPDHVPADWVYDEWWKK